MDKLSKTDKKRLRRTFSPEFKADAVRLCRTGDRSIAQVAMELDRIETSLREWVHRADIDAGKGPVVALRRWTAIVSAPPISAQSLSSLRWRCPRTLGRSWSFSPRS